MGITKLLYFTSAISALICITYAETPPYITKCKRTDAKCARESAAVAIPIFAAGLPNASVEPLDPVTFKTVDASSPNLKFVLTDVTVTGLKNCKAKKIQRDPVSSKMHLKFECSAKLDGNYEMKGQVLVLPIEGKGKIEVDLKTTEIFVDLDIVDKTGDDGKKYWHITRANHSFELKDKSDVRFHGLFDGNEVLSKAANDLIANNGNDIIREIGEPMIKTTVTRVVRNIENFFSYHPIDELSLE